MARFMDAVYKQESNENIVRLLGKIKYREHKLDTYTNVNVVVILLGLQLVYALHYCFICKWDNQTRNSHRTFQQRPPRGQNIPE